MHGMYICFLTFWKKKMKRLVRSKIAKFIWTYHLENFFQTKTESIITYYIKFLKTTPQIDYFILPTTSLPETFENGQKQYQNLTNSQLEFLWFLEFAWHRFRRVICCLSKKFLIDVYDWWLCQPWKIGLTGSCSLFHNSKISLSSSGKGKNFPMFLKKD